MHKRLFLLISIFFSSQANQLEPFIHFGFDLSMEKSQYPKAIPTTRHIVGLDGTVLYNFFKKQYQENVWAMSQPTVQPKIPKRIHQIWIGCPVPEELKAYMQSWQDFHPDWEYYLWTDENVHKVKLYNQEYYDQAENVGVKSDILKWELIYQFGGLYVDCDFECFRSMDLFNHTCDFYTGMQPLATQFVQLGAALFAAAPGHIVLKHCIETIKDDWHRKGAPQKSGPVHFTRSFYAVAGKTGMVDIAFPATYFYPMYGMQTKTEIERWLRQGSFAVHHWGRTWMPANHRSGKFRNINNFDVVQNWND